MRTAKCVLELVTMCSLGFWSVLVLAVEVSSTVIDIKGAEVSRCYQCVGSNRTRCEGLGPSVMCPPDRPVCATTAAAPGFESSLTCAAAIPSTCSLAGLQLTCTCAGHLCNRPYSAQLANELKNLARVSGNATLEMLLNSSVFVNVSAANLYETITVQTLDGANFSIGPRAEALKHEPTLSPDDEDDGEGSGSFDDKVPSAPAAPSSFLPSERNDANILGLKSLVLVIHFSLVLKYS